MSDLDFQLAHQLNSVLGWLELGNLKEARAELEHLAVEHADDPDVLEIRWTLHGREADWEGALAVAERLFEVRPESSVSWLHRAYALRRAASGGLVRAAEALRPAFEKFPDDPTIPFNLACYACQLGKLSDARTWLREAFQRGEHRHIKTMALSDTDLEKLWSEIRTW